MVEMLLDGVEVDVVSGGYVFAGETFHEWDDLETAQRERIEELVEQLRVIHGQLKDAILLSGEFVRTAA